MITFGELPDIISLSQGDKLEELGMNGKILPLNDLIDKYAPNIKAFLKNIHVIKKMQFLQMETYILSQIIMIGML